MWLGMHGALTCYPLRGRTESAVGAVRYGRDIRMIPAAAASVAFAALSPP